MTYRNITVNSINYKYVIGRKFTKVVNIGSVANSDLGALVGQHYTKLERFMRYLSYNEFKEQSTYIVTPADVRRMILGGGKVDVHFHDGPHTCSNCNKISYDVILWANPFYAEIHQKYYYGYRCDTCYDLLAEDI